MEMSDSGIRSDRAVARDRGLRRVARLKRWLAALVVGLTAALSAVAAQALPGASLRQAPSSTRRASVQNVVHSVQSGPMAPDPTADDPAASAPAAGNAAGSEQLQPPPEPPAPAPVDQSSGAVSGGS